MKKPTITALILTRNEASRLPGCLKNLAWVDEIIVLDDHSSDQTLEIAKKFKAKIYKRKLDNFANQRNFGLTKVKTDWVFLIDADEEVGPELRREIQEAIKQKENDGYYFPRKNIIFGQWIKQSGWFPDYQLHLFKTKKGKYFGQVHERVKLEGKAAYLKNALIHHNYQTVSQYLQKLDQYTTLAAQAKIKSGEGADFKKILKEPIAEFLKRFFAEKGYQDGFHGLVLSLLQAFAALVVLVKVWEIQGFKPQRLLLDDFVLTTKKLGKEISYWLTTVLIKETKSPFKKYRLKLKRRLLK